MTFITGYLNTYLFSPALSPALSLSLSLSLSPAVTDLLHGDIRDGAGGPKADHDSLPPSPLHNGQRPVPHVVRHVAFWWGTQCVHGVSSAHRVHSVKVSGVRNLHAVIHNISVNMDRYTVF